MSERRQSTRQKSFLRGCVYFNNRRSATDCLIRDISPTGARLIFSDTVSIPDLVELYIPQKEQSLRARVQWRDVWVGAAVTALLFTVGKHLIGLYIGKSSVASGYGAAGSLVVVLVWVYYSAQIFLLGVEFTWVYAHEYGSFKGRPRPGADGP